jgi:hypothetical protein
VLDTNLSKVVIDLNPTFGHADSAKGKGDLMNWDPDSNPLRYGIVAAAVMAITGNTTALPTERNVPLIHARYRVIVGTDGVHDGFGLIFALFLGGAPHSRRDQCLELSACPAVCD